MESSGPPRRPSVLPCSKCPDLQGPSDPATASHRIPLTKFAMPVLASHSETVAGRINRSDPFELLVLGPMVLRNGRRIIADSTHPTSSRPLSPPENGSRPLICPERLELHEWKHSRAVLRGGGGGDVTSLPDPQGSNPLGRPGRELRTGASRLFFQKILKDFS